MTQMDEGSLRSGASGEVIERVAERLASWGISFVPQRSDDPIYDRLAERVVDDVITPELERRDAEIDRLNEVRLNTRVQWRADLDEIAAALGIKKDLPVARIVHWAKAAGDLVREAHEQQDLAVKLLVARDEERDALRAQLASLTNESFISSPAPVTESVPATPEPPVGTFLREDGADVPWSVHRRSDGWVCIKAGCPNCPMDWTEVLDFFKNLRQVTVQQDAAPSPKATSEASPNPQITNEINKIPTPPSAGEADTAPREPRMWFPEDKAAWRGRVVTVMTPPGMQVVRLPDGSEASVTPDELEVLPNTEQEAEK